jgi:ATP-dependent DNA helicase DinG
MTDAPAMSYKSTWKDYEAQADVIADICSRHKHDRVLIHTTRWRHANDLADRLAKKGLQDRVWVPDAKTGRLEQIAKLTNPYPPDLIAIGPSFWEGLDLKQDLCRCVIVAKIPWGDRSDPVVAARLRQEGGGKWDRWCAALKVVQGCGRAVRDAEDYAVAYIADGSWNRVASYSPAWFHVET